MIDANKLLSSGMKAKVLSIDWISTTSKFKPLSKEYSSHPSLHDWENWNECNAKMGYTVGAKHTTGVTTFSNPNRVDMGQHTIYSGSSLKRVNEYNGTDSYDILEYHRQSLHSITRLDIAVDFFNYGLTVGDFEKCFLSGNAETKIKTATKVKSLTHAGHTLYIGSQKRKKKLVRVYDKAAEQGKKGDWIRVELQIMGKPATKASDVIVGSDSNGEGALSVLKGVIDFKSIDVWSDLMENMSKSEIGTVSGEQGDTRRWLIQQCVPALAREIVLDNIFWDEFVQAVNQRVYENEASRKK